MVWEGIWDYGVPWLQYYYPNAWDFWHMFHGEHSMSGGPIFRDSVDGAYIIAVLVGKGRFRGDAACGPMLNTFVK